MTMTFELMPKQMSNQAITVLSESLIIEPGFMHIVPNESDRIRVMRAVMAAEVDSASRNGKVWIARDDSTVVGAAVCVAPGMYPPTRWENVRVMRHYRGIRRFGKSVLEPLSDFEKNAAMHYPEKACWYLKAFGVAPGNQGKGVGSGLLRTMLAEIGREDCYLETATPANLDFYRRQGFEIQNPAAQLAPKDGPTHWTMLRPGQ